MTEYLADIPPEMTEYGFSKVLRVRQEMIHIKHVMTEVFVRRSIDLRKYLSVINMSVDDYLATLTNVIRKVHRFSRDYPVDCNVIVQKRRSRFMPSLDVDKPLNSVVVLDFDGVMTDKEFWPLYKILRRQYEVHICSGNPTIEEDWFHRRNLGLPVRIHAMKGKKKKIKRLVELQRKYDTVFFVDNEKSYLEFAWIFGIHTFRWTDRRIKYFSMNGGKPGLTRPTPSADNGEKTLFRDRRGREWERFTDRSYFDLVCVRLANDREFSSATSFHFNTQQEADEFVRLVEGAH